jgi:hypothetical protein
MAKKNWGEPPPLFFFFFFEKSELSKMARTLTLSLKFG